MECAPRVSCGRVAPLFNSHCAAAHLVTFLKYRLGHLIQVNERFDTLVLCRRGRWASDQSSGQNVRRTFAMYIRFLMSVVLSFVFVAGSLPGPLPI